MKSQFLLAAAHSGAGKTTVTLGLLKALQRRGYSMQAFKCGPDYIDPIHHRTASGRDSINLDRYMMSDDHIRSLYDRYGAGASVCITEGVMGLFDGARKSEGSSADIAKLLNIPVILVLNAKAMAYSAAAILYGLKHFDPGVRIAGVLFNFVNSATHYQLLREACEDVGVKALGYLPVNEGLSIPSRHLGLDTGDAAVAIAAAADHMEKHVDLEELLAVTAEGATLSGRSVTEGKEVAGTGSAPGGELSSKPDPAPAPGSGRKRTVLIARDAAFHFLYPENIRQLELWGRVVYFSPLTDALMPVIPDLLYLPGGYPELYLEELAGNGGLQQQIRDYAAGGGKIVAECGGMMYLGRSITDESGRQHPMVGLLDLTTSMQVKKLSMGYRTLVLDGQRVKGHEFHYSQFVDTPLVASGEVYNARDQRVETPVIYTPRLFASYMHFYWGEGGSLLENWLEDDAGDR